MKVAWRACLALCLFALLWAGCSARRYRKSADQDVYGIIHSKSALVTNMDPRFTIEATNAPGLEFLRVSTNLDDFLGAAGDRERGARVLTLQEALTTAVRMSRRYQAEKESLYLAALGLTLVRHQFTPIFSTSAEVEHRVDEITLSEDPEVNDDIESFNERPVNAASSTVRASWLIRDLGRITTAFTFDALRLVTGDRSLATSSELSATFTRPLLRNAGFKAEMEALTQAERSLLYDLRNFVQFRKNFSVEVASAYYAVLGARDVARNSYLNLQSSKKNAERSRELAQEGRIRQSELGRLEQQELSAESSWINAIRSYQQDLDNFKLLLGLNVDENLVLDDRELEQLRVLDPLLAQEDAVTVALAARLDYINARDELEDRERKVDLAINALRPQLDLAADARILNNPETDALVAVPTLSRRSWSASLFLDPGLDRMAERNAYRAALISRDRAAREVEQLEDNIKLQVRDSWRNLDQAKRNYEISKIAVKLAERRVEEQNLLAEFGRANAQDQVDAQNDLIDQKNQLTRSIVAHTISRLQFWNRLGILYIKENGQWEETQDAETK